jgi:hypothetical protein
VGGSIESHHLLSIINASMSRECGPINLVRRDGQAECAENTQLPQDAPPFLVLTHFEPIKNLAWLNYPVFAIFLTKHRHLFQSTTTSPSPKWLHESLQVFREEIENVKSIAGLNPHIITYPIPSRAIRGMTDRGGNALGLGDVQGPLLSKSASSCRACIGRVF